MAHPQEDPAIIERATTQTILIHLQRFKRKVDCLFVGSCGLCLSVSVPFLSHKYSGDDSL